jgi:hypothetical protein
MPELQFDLDKSFTENLEAFKRHVTALDPVLSGILFDHLDKLQVGDDQTRNRASRTQFNQAVLAALEALPPPSDTL